MGKFKAKDRVCIDIPWEEYHVFKCYDGCYGTVVKETSRNLYSVRIDQTGGSIEIDGTFLVPEDKAQALDNAFDSIVDWLDILNSFTEEDYEKYDARKSTKSIKTPQFDGSWVKERLLELRVLIELALFDNDEDSFKENIAEYNRLTDEASYDMIEYVRNNYRNTEKYITMERKNQR